MQLHGLQIVPPLPCSACGLTCSTTSPWIPTHLETCDREKVRKSEFYNKELKLMVDKYGAIQHTEGRAQKSASQDVMIPQMSYLNPLVHQLILGRQCNEPLNSSAASIL